jgi:phage terminase large subunit GpA
MGAAPLYATPRNPSRPTEGPQVAAVARALGTPLIPWQRYVADVAGERRADGSYEYQVVIVSVPRQTGKTTLIRSVGTYRCLVCQRDVFYTAQTGKDARERWMDLVKLLRVNDALKDHVRIGLRGGSEQITFRGAAAFRVFAPTPESLHGYTPPTVMIDEAFALAASAGELLMGAIGPAQITIVDKQIWIVSTMGTAESTFLHDWIDRALGGMARVALFLWGASDEQDPYTPEGVSSFHPGIGFELGKKTLTAADVLEQVDRNTRAEYERAYANRRTVTASHLIPAAVWGDLLDPSPEPPPDPSRVTVAYDVGLDRRSAAILAAWSGPDGRPRVRVVQSGPGIAWLSDAVAELRKDWRPRDVVAVGNGPVLEVTADLRKRGEHIRELTEREFATATGSFLSSIDEAGFLHHGGDVLDRSVTGLVTRSGAVDGVAISRRHSVGDSSAGVAAIASLWVHRQEQHSGAVRVRVPA